MVTPSYWGVAAEAPERGDWLVPFFL